MNTKRRDLLTIIAIGIILGALVASQARAGTGWTPASGPRTTIGCLLIGH